MNYEAGHKVGVPSATTMLGYCSKSKNRRTIKKKVDYSGKLDGLA